MSEFDKYWLIQQKWFEIVIGQSKRTILGRSNFTNKFLPKFLPGYTCLYVFPFDDNLDQLFDQRKEL